MPTKLAADLADGDRFSLDGGATWHTCAVVLFGSVAVYTSDRRDGDAPTIRLDVARDATVTVPTPYLSEAAEQERLAAEGDWCPVCTAYTDSYQNDDCVVCARPRTTPTRTA